MDKQDYNIFQYFKRYAKYHTRFYRIRAADARRISTPRPIHHPLNPKKDPESLYCDTEFLEAFLGKKL